MEVDLTFGFCTRYRTSFVSGLHENEIVDVYFGQLRGPADPCPPEIVDLRFADLNAIRRDIQDQPQSYAYWFRHYIESHFDEMARFPAASS